VIYINRLDDIINEKNVNRLLDEDKELEKEIK